MPEGRKAGTDRWRDGHDAAHCNPEPDVTVINADLELGQIYATKFYFVAEILSPNDKSYVLELKREFHTSHANCRGVMFVSQDRVFTQLITRDTAGWGECALSDAATPIDIPDIGVVGTLGALYRYTPLQAGP